MYTPANAGGQRAAVSGIAVYCLMLDLQRLLSDADKEAIVLCKGDAIGGFPFCFGFRHVISRFLERVAAMVGCVALRFCPGGGFSQGW